MSEEIQLNYQIDNIYEFDLEMEGLKSQDVRAWFVIKAKDVELTFPCKQDGKHFICKIPPIPYIDQATYKGAVRLVVDDYFFEIVSDLLVKVSGTPNVEGASIKNMTVKSTIEFVKAEAKKDKEEKKPIEIKTNKKEDTVKIEDVKKKTDNKEPVTEATGDPKNPKISTDVTRVDSVKDIAKRVMQDAQPSLDMDRKEKPAKTVKGPIPLTPNKRNIDGRAHVDAEPPPEPQDYVKDDSFKKKTQPTKEELKTAESKSKMVKKTIIDQAQKLYKEDADSRFTRKGAPKTEEMIESEVSKFVSAEQTERDNRLRDILQNFTVDPDSTPTKARFSKKD